MSQQHRKWIDLVKERIEQRGWSQTDLAIVVGVSPSDITQLVKDGKGSDDLKPRINKKLRINESWEKFEEQKNETEPISVQQEEKLMEKIIAYSVEELYEKVAEQEKRISEIEMRLGIKHLEDTSS